MGDLFSIGSRVRATKAAVDQGLAAKNILGTVTTVTENNISVRWDDRVTAQEFHPTFLEPAPASAPTKHRSRSAVAERNDRIKADRSILRRAYDLATGPDRDRLARALGGKEPSTKYPFSDDVLRFAADFLSLSDKGSAP